MLDQTDSLRGDLDRLRAQAQNEALPARRSDAALYSLLAEVLRLCERVSAEGRHSELRDEITVSIDVRGRGNAGRGRRFAFKDADEFTLVCRHVFSENRGAAYRYAASLREARDRQIRSGDLVEYLTTHGGVRELFMRRDSIARTGSTKTLNLDRPVRYEKGKRLTLTISYQGDGTFRVIEAAE